MHLRRSLAAGALALTTVVVAGPLAATASAQTGTSSPPVAQNLNCRRIVKQVRNVTQRLARAQARLAYWQRVAAEMPGRIEAQHAKIAELQSQLAAATGDAAADLQTQLDEATEKLGWMQAKLEASGRRIPAWTDAIARLTALQGALGEQATAGECPLPTTTTTTVTPEDTTGSSTTSTVPGAAQTEDDDEGDDDGPSAEDRSAAERLAEAQRRNAERLAEAQRRNAERVAEAQKRAAEAQRRARESQRRNRPTTSAPTPTVEDRSGDSGAEQDDD
ncbi:MAG: hypothetical protein ACKO04_04885 [Actinomycetes bacterium]